MMWQKNNILMSYWTNIIMKLFWNVWQLCSWSFFDLYVVC